MYFMPLLAVSLTVENPEKEWVALDRVTPSAKVEMKSMARIALRPNRGNI